MSEIKSVFAEFAWRYLEREISVVPIAPGQKIPGAYSQQNGWEGMASWVRFNDRLPSDIELSYWEQWPDAGIGVITGKQSRIVAVDKDMDLPAAGEKALLDIIPYSPVAKKGKKGWTRFYRYSGEKSRSFDAGGARIIDVISDGRQTVVPPTLHPDGMHYTWITEDALDSIDSVDDLPALPADFFDQIELALGPYQTEKEKIFQRRVSHRDRGAIDTAASIQAEYYSDINRIALDNLDLWVPVLIKTAARHSDGYRSIAIWRGRVKTRNVGINPQGIRDWGGGYGMSPITLVMYENGLSFQQAVELLRACIPMNEPEHITFTVNGKPIQSAPPQVTYHEHIALDPVSPPPPPEEVETGSELPPFVENPPGILGDIARWITATAPKPQPELSLAAAIALCSVIMGRSYSTQFGNMTSLYLIMIAKSTEGKEHPQECVNNTLAATGLDNLIGGSGYTSAGAVHSALLKSPCHIITVDEIGKMLKLSRAAGQSNSEAAIDKIIEAYGRLRGIMRPPQYSTMTISTDATKKTNAEKTVHYPAITLLGATTPGTFYANLTGDLIKDGFLGRCIVIESKRPRQLTQFVPRNPPHKRITDWCKAVHRSWVMDGVTIDAVVPDQDPEITEIQFDRACIAELPILEEEINSAKTVAEDDDLDSILGRTLEKAMRLSLIVTKARHSNATVITIDDLRWAYQYVRHYDMLLVDAVRKNRSANEYDALMRKAVDLIKGARKLASNPKLLQFARVLADGAMPHKELLRRMHMKASEFNGMIETAVEAGLITRAPGVGLGYAGMVYYCVEE